MGTNLVQLKNQVTAVSVELGNVQETREVQRTQEMKALRDQQEMTAMAELMQQEIEQKLIALAEGMAELTDDIADVQAEVTFEKEQVKDLTAEKDQLQCDMKERIGALEIAAAAAEDSLKAQLIT